ncbi:MAG TPA: hypothetical protein VF463_07795 [Sphingobium sp.]
MAIIDEAHVPATLIQPGNLRHAPIGALLHVPGGSTYLMASFPSGTPGEGQKWLIDIDTFKARGVQSDDDLTKVAVIENISFDVVPFSACDPEDRQPGDVLAGGGMLLIVGDNSGEKITLRLNLMINDKGLLAYGRWRMSAGGVIVAAKLFDD